MKVIALSLAILLLPRVASAACAETDNECLLRLTLQQTYDLEASREENRLMQQRMEQAEERASAGGKIFVVGMFIGAAFFGSLYTLSKAFK